MDGGYAEFVTLRSEAVVSVPTDLDPAEVAPLLCAGVTTFSEFVLLSEIDGTTDRSFKTLSVTWTFTREIFAPFKASGQ
jgi:hypothetical protein